MIYEADEFVFEPPPEVARARRVLVKPCARYPFAYPVSTSRETLATVVAGIRRVSDADILFLESAAPGYTARQVYQALNYDFPRVMRWDVEESFTVEVENPLAKPFTMSTFRVPNIILYCDYLISVAPLRITPAGASLTVPNLLGLIPRTRRGQGESLEINDLFCHPDIEGVMADLYFTLPFDLGIVDARKKFVCGNDPTQGREEDCGLIFVGEPYDVDREACRFMGVDAGYLRLIQAARGQLMSQNVDGKPVGKEGA
ncbi:MAG: DUF362 domain-containing protein [Chloroflexi bacterium]|nr:DUF362 domain-containing protein [Chloroflexota bacterium]